MMSTAAKLKRRKYEEDMLRREKAVKWAPSVNQRANAADKLAFAKCRNAGGSVEEAKRAGELAFSAVVAQAIQNGDPETLAVSEKYLAQKPDTAESNRVKWSRSDANPWDGSLKRCSDPRCNFEHPRVNDGTWTRAVTKVDGLHTLCAACRSTRNRQS